VLEFNQFTGPIGGIVCLAFAMGCVAGWGFAMKLMASRIADLKEDCLERDKVATERIKEANARITAMDARLKTLDDMLLNGMERQLAQVRVSTERAMKD
jgi:methylthioribose-1-phosphate isomerase